MCKLYKCPVHLSIEIERISEKSRTLVEVTKIISIFVHFIPEIQKEIETNCLDKRKKPDSLRDNPQISNSTRKDEVQ